MCEPPAAAGDPERAAQQLQHRLLEQTAVVAEGFSPKVSPPERDAWLSRQSQGRLTAAGPMQARQLWPASSPSAWWSLAALRGVECLAHLRFSRYSADCSVMEASPAAASRSWGLPACRASCARQLACSLFVPVSFTLLFLSLKLGLACLQEVCLHPLVAMPIPQTERVAAVRLLPAAAALQLLQYLAKLVQLHAGKYN